MLCIIALLFPVSSTFVQSSSYALSLSQSSSKFEVTKSLSSSPLLFLISINSPPFFEFDNTTSSFNFSCDYFDSQGWILNSNSLLISIPGSVSGTAYLGTYSLSQPPYYSVKQSTISTSACLDTCTNGGVCNSGTCDCTNYYGGYSCEVELTPTVVGIQNLVQLQPGAWGFYRIEAQADLFIQASASSSGKYMLFIEAEVSGNEIPTMLDSQSAEFDEDNSIFGTYFINSGSAVRIGIYCSDSSYCTGFFQADAVQNMNAMWIIIFSVIIGCFLLTSIPITIVYCSNRGGKNKPNCTQLSKEQMQVMFPGKEYVGEDLCPICLEVLGNGGICRELACSHLFHAGCIDEWTTSNLFCPVCKQNLILEFNLKKYTEQGESEESEGRSKKVSNEIVNHHENKVIDEHIRLNTEA